MARVNKIDDAWPLIGVASVSVTIISSTNYQSFFQSKIMTDKQITLVVKLSAVRRTTITNLNISDHSQRNPGICGDN